MSSKEIDEEVERYIQWRINHGWSSNNFSEYYSDYYKFVEKFPEFSRKFQRVDNNTHGNRKKNTDILFLTINPKPDVDFLTFKNCVERFVKLKPIKGATYAYEQRLDASGVGSRGYHCHILVDRNDKPYVIEKEARRIFHDVVGDVKNVNQLNFSWRADSEREKSLKYIRGIKDGEAKQAKCEEDIQWRKSLNIDDIYYCGGHSLVRPPQIVPKISQKLKLNLA